MYKRFTMVLVILFSGVIISIDIVAEQTLKTQAEQILEVTGVKGGFVVHIGCGDGKLTGALRLNESYLVHGLDADPSNVEKAREYIRSLGIYGKVSVECWNKNYLPYIDNLVNLVVCENPGAIPEKEIMRVLCPNGVAYIKKDGNWTKTVKPRPKEIDEWTHYLYDASNNAVSHDLLVGPPFHIQWVGEPKCTRHHDALPNVNVVVSSGGRIFYIADEAPAASLQLSARWFLVCQDAFNGILLWKKKISSWESHLRNLYGSTQLYRRLVAIEDRVYVTLSLQAPVTALDAATGNIVRVYEGTEKTQEILYSNGILYVVVGAQPDTKSILSINAQTGEVLWKKTGADVGQILPLSIAIGTGRVFFQNSEAVVCLDSKSGNELWRFARKTVSKRPDWSAPTLVAYEDVVLCTDRKLDASPPGTDKKTGEIIPRWLADASSVGEMLALSAKTGQMLWSCESAEAYYSPADIFVINGLAWIGKTISRNFIDFTEAHNPITGEIKKQISTEKIFTNAGMPHHRCYRDKATDKYILTGRAGVEFIDIEKGEGTRHHWIRGTCRFGILPSNGLLYVPPHSCACYLKGKLNGFYVLSPKRKEPGSRSTGSGQIERGPAYEKILDLSSEKPGDWHTYRHDTSRSGSTKSPVPATLNCIWQSNLEGKLSSPVVAGGIVFVAKVDEHIVYAIDATSGKTLWTFFAGARVDSPPTVYKGLAVFGSADGWVYCLKSSDGKLIWRFCAAPEDRRIVAFGQVESVWPVNGSVLVQDEVVYCAAGRSSFLDNGIYLYRLDLKTGRKLSEQRIYTRDSKTGEQPEEEISWFDMPGAFPDILSSEGDLVYMRHLGFDRNNLEQREADWHLFSPTGFLDDTWWYRSYWIYGTQFYYGYIGWFFAGKQVPAGRLLVFDETSIYGFACRPEYYTNVSNMKYHLFATTKEKQNIEKPYGELLPKGGEFRVNLKWSNKVPILARAMVLADKTLFLAGPPESALSSKSAFEGEKGGAVFAISATDGKTLAEYKLDYIPVFDGMAAANGMLYVSTQDGRLLCLGSKELKVGQDGFHLARMEAGDEQEKPRVSEKLLSETKSRIESPRETALGGELAGHWKFDEGKGEIAKDDSGRGNNAEISGNWAKGKFGTCIFTKGMPAAITIPDGPDIQFGTSDFSFEFWVKMDEFEKRIMGKDDFPKTWITMNVLNKEGKIELVLTEANEAGKAVRHTFKTPLSMEKWNHVAFVVDRKNFLVNCYMNGMLDSTTKIPPTLTGDLSVKEKSLQIPSSFKPFTGLFDELKIYKRVLTDAEILASYEKEKDKRTSAEYKLIEE